MNRLPPILLAVSLLLPACGRSPEEEATGAQAVVDAFLTAASSGEGNRGWEYLSPATQASLFNSDFEAYRRAADAAEWDAFEWEVINVARDEPGLYQVVIRPVPDMPAFVDRFTSWEDGLLTGGPTFLVRFIDLTGPPRIHQRDT